MKEFLDIVEGAQRMDQAGIPAVLASVVKTQGSTYRHPGARMLLAADGTTIGMVSGGCLENDLRDRAIPIIASQGRELITYDSTSSDDIVWGLGLGCAGMVHVMVEGTSRPEVRRYLEIAQKALNTDEPFVVGTIFSTRGAPGVESGSRWLQSRDAGDRIGTWDEKMSGQMRNACGEALSSGHSELKVISAHTGSAEAFLEVVHPAMPLLVFGAGPDAVPLARLAGELGWKVSVFDTRQAYLTSFAAEVMRRMLLQQPADLLDAIALRGHEAAVVMTHNFNLDFEFLKVLLPSPVRYIGVLGSRQKSSMLLSKLKEEGFGPTSAQKVRLFSPMGLDLGAETPAEIALSVVAEIQSLIASGTGRSLRTLRGNIHPLHA